jgi:chromate reductase, NAD(P)H dehydrogenase (quinone)
VKVAIIVGSLRSESYNKKLALAIVSRLPEGSQVEWVNADMPLFSEDVENSAVPEPVLRAAEQLQSSDAVLFVSPEYNRSFSGVMKNAIDWLSRESVGYPLDKKKGAIAGATESAIGTAVMQSQLRPILSHMGMDILALPEVFVSVPTRMSPSGELTEKTTATIEKFIVALTQHIRQN